jgi:hypothetical protein
MKPRQLFVVLLSFVMLAPILLPQNSISQATAQTAPDVYVGVDMGYGTDVAGAKSLIDQVSNFTNFFILGTYAFSNNITQLNETLQYAYDKNMTFMSFPPPLYSRNLTVPQSTLQWLNYTKANWGDHLAGFIYPYEDEPGGHQLDKSGVYLVVENMTATDWGDAASQYTNSMWFWDLNRTRNVTGYPLYTSDYALYYFDYKGGYDGLFAEFNWNYSRQLTISLIRGAATVLNKQWGVIITHTTPPYVLTKNQLYNDMVDAYDGGAKYIVVFDSNENWTAGCLTAEHFEAMKQFWEYAKSHPRATYPIDQRVAYALPEAFGYGFRGPEDHIWCWPANMTSFMLSESVQIMLLKWGAKLDITYEDALSPSNPHGYGNIYYWNDPSAVADLWPNYMLPLPESSPTPTPSPETTPTDSAAPRGFFVPYEHAYATVAVVTTASVVALIFKFRKKS